MEWKARSAGDVLDRPSTQARLNLVIVGKNIFVLHPILGVGPGNSGYFIGEGGDFALREHARNERLILNNVYVEHLAETGLLGTVCFLAFLGWLAFGFLRADRKNPAKWFLMAGFLCLVFSMAASPNHLVTWYWVACAGVVAWGISFRKGSPVAFQSTAGSGS
jgi:O-antigen ligase